LSRIAVALACTPAVVVALVGAWGVVANPAGGWVWPPDDVNVSEAVATRNYAELVRLLENGADPTRPYPVQASLLTSRPVVATPVEAAVMARNAGMLGLLIDKGAVITPAMAGRLKCLNADYPDQDVRAMLDRVAPGTEPDCPVDD
jgi:hypothetical protein